MGRRKLGRNEACHCGSGQKYKKCCMRLDELVGGGLEAPGTYSALGPGARVVTPGLVDAPREWDLGGESRVEITGFVHALGEWDLDEEGVGGFVVNPLLLADQEGASLAPGEYGRWGSVRGEHGSRVATWEEVARENPGVEERAQRLREATGEGLSQEDVRWAAWIFEQLERQTGRDWS